MPKKPTPTTDLHPDSAGRPMDDSGDYLSSPRKERTAKEGGPMNDHSPGLIMTRRPGERIGENTEIEEQ